MKWRALFPIMLILVCFSGCTKAPEEAAFDDVREKFLTRYFTTDYNGRCTALEDAGFSEEGLEAYYAGFAPVATERCIQTMLENREPVSLDRLFRNAGSAAHPENMEFEVYSESEDGCVYTVTFELVVEGAAETRGSMEGQLMVDKETGLVAHLHLAESNEVIQNLLN